MEAGDVWLWSESIATSTAFTLPINVTTRIFRYPDKQLIFISSDSKFTQCVSGSGTNKMSHINDVH